MMKLFFACVIWCGEDTIIRAERGKKQWIKCRKNVGAGLGMDDTQAYMSRRRIRRLWVREGISVV